jgi:hypothetical protein
MLVDRERTDARLGAPMIDALKEMLNPMGPL